MVVMLCWRADMRLSLMEFPPNIFTWISLQAICMANILVALENSSFKRLKEHYNMYRSSHIFLSNKKVLIV